jgi:sugar O-acyltransferase (sialic acid O-acetyltransferase NeuD family)
METLVVPVKIPLLNPNEPEAKLVSLAIEEGQFVKEGDLLCTLETTKSTADLVADRDGYVIGLFNSEGDTVKAGAQLCVLSADENWQPDIEQVDFQEIKEAGKSTQIPVGLRISKPALILAQSSNLELNELPIGPLVTESLVQEFIDKTNEPDRQDFDFDLQELIVYGGGGHGKSVIDLIRTSGIYHIHGVVDDGIKPGTSILGVQVLGGRQVLPELHSQGIRQAVNAVGGIGDITNRIKVFQSLAENGFVCPTISHPSAVIEPSANIAPGVQVFPQAYVGSEARVGFGVIINTGAIVSHECILEAYTNISPGSVLAGDVKIGQGSLIGMGVTVNLGVKIGENSKIGNSATIKSDVAAGSIIKAGAIWPD